MPWSADLSASPCRGFLGGKWLARAGLALPVDGDAGAGSQGLFSLLTMAPWGGLFPGVLFQDKLRLRKLRTEMILHKKVIGWGDLFTKKAGEFPLPPFVLPYELKGSGKSRHAGA